MSTTADHDHTTSDLGTRLTLTVEEAAALIGISRSGAYDAVHRGEIPARRIGNRILVLRAPLEQLFERSGGPDEPGDQGGHIYADRRLR